MGVYHKMTGISEDISKVLTGEPFSTEVLIEQVNEAQKLTAQTMNLHISLMFKSSV